MNLTLGAVLGGAIIDAWNPCAIGVLLLLVSLILSAADKRPYLWLFGLFYVAGVYLTYFLIGLGLLQTMDFFGIHNFFAYLSAILLIVFGTAHIRPQLVYWIPGVRWLVACKVPHGQRQAIERGAILSGLAFGILVGICEFPCSGGVYMGIIALLAATTTFWQGIGYLAFYNLIFILPLLLILLFMKHPAVIRQLESVHSSLAHKLTIAMGWVMVLAGLGLLAWLIVR